MTDQGTGICFIINLALSTPQRVFDFFTGWIFSLLNIEAPNILTIVGDVFGCGF